MPPLALWGGIECTVNRVGDGYRDQTRLSGHHNRPDDLARIAALGILTLRYPLLWERVAPDRPDACDWEWSDGRLSLMRALGIAPILGLLHHGSGPRYTSLIDPDFPAKLGAYAAVAAARYPHVLDWTPVNEPLTTARFSALYGHWYPHLADEAAFWRALLNQIDGTRAAMRAIRRVQPAARLIQTEDLGRTWATPTLRSVADFYNDRRWATWDLLAGKVGTGHPLWARIAGVGLGDRLRAIADDPCPPDVIGLNHYVTSDRFLDDREAAGPAPAIGFHDVAAIRALDPPPAGLGGALAEAWARYRRPIAVTECHLGCTREEQLRWLAQGWAACAAARRDGADVRALTAWALFGSTDWDSLLTVQAGHHEPGAFDASSGTPRPTALATLVAAFASGTAPPAALTALMAEPGWWQRPIRLEHHPFAHDGPAAPPTRPAALTFTTEGPPDADLAAIVKACRRRGLTCRVGGIKGQADTTIDAVAAATDPAGIDAHLDRLIDRLGDHPDPEEGESLTPCLSASECRPLAPCGSD